MNKKIIIVPIIIAVIGIIFVNISEENSIEKNNKTVFHVTLADPTQYENGVYSETFDIIKGNYKFTFVPNGDSPKNLAISLLGKDYNYVENFKLEGTLHETGISEYYTWEYIGDEQEVILESQTLEIQINPNGNIVGTVSISIIEN